MSDLGLRTQRLCPGRWLLGRDLPASLLERQKLSLTPNRQAPRCTHLNVQDTLTRKLQSLLPCGASRAVCTEDGASRLAEALFLL